MLGKGMKRNQKHNHPNLIANAKHSHKKKWPKKITSH
jgi:hypothetical protein